MKIIALLIILLIYSVGVSSATDYYVNNSWSGASDSNTGLSNSNTTAWLTIQKATSTLIVGDTVYVMGGGNFYESDVLETTSGNSSNYISYIGINEPVVNDSTYAFKVTADYVAVRNFTITNSSYGFWIDGKHNIIDGNTLNDWTVDTIGIVLYDYSNYSTVINNKIKAAQNSVYLRGELSYLNISYNEMNTSGVGYGTLYFWGGGKKRNCTFIGNTIRGGRNGFAGGSMINATIIDNNIAYHSHNALNLHSTEYSTIKNNWVGKARPGYDANGIFTATEGDWWYFNVLDGNTGYNVSGNSYKCCNAKNFTIRNTTMYSPGGYGIQFLYGFSSTGQNASGNVTVSNATFTTDTCANGINFCGTNASLGDYLLYGIRLGGYAYPWSYSWASGGHQPTSKACIINANTTTSTYLGATGGIFQFGYPLDVKVVDISDNPISGANVSITMNSSDVYPTVYDLSPEGRIQNISSSLTGTDGHLPLPYGNESTSLGIIDFQKTVSGTTEYSFNISVSKEGYIANNSVTDINPDSSWYRTSLNSYENTITVILSVSSGTPTPTNLNYTKGDSWVNHTWSAGVGNVTDSYNVSINGTWYNITTDTFYNHTGLSAEIWSNSTIQAWNSTYSELSNSVSQNVQIPESWSPVLNHIYAPNILNRIYSNGTITWMGKQPVQSDIDLSASGFNVVIS